MIIPAAIAVVVAPFYLLTSDFTLIVICFLLQGLFGGAIYSQLPSYLCEMFPTEVRATASGFCYHQGAIFGGLVVPILTFFTIQQDLGLGIPTLGHGIPMLAGTVIGALSVICALLLSPETKGRVLVSELVVA